MLGSVLLASLSDWNTISNIASNIATVVALLVGGAWAYFNFLRERIRWPKAEVDIVFAERRLSDEFILVNVTVRVKNYGRGLMQLTRIRVDLRRVLPIDDDTMAKIHSGDQYRKDGVKARWPRIGKLERVSSSGQIELEPGETDEFGFDFFVSPSTEVVQAYAFVENVTKGYANHFLGWGVTQLHDIAANPRRLEDTMTGKPGPKEEPPPPSIEPQEPEEDDE